MSRSASPSFAAIALLALLAGCAQPRPAPSPPAPSPTASIDGTYKGAANGSCGTDQPATATLRDGRFTLTVPPDLRLEGRASGNGVLNATQIDDAGREVNFSGQIDGKLLRGGSYNGKCAFAYAMTRDS
jgi:hypothetical protein